MSTCRYKEGIWGAWTQKRFLVFDEREIQEVYVHHKHSTQRSICASQTHTVCVHHTHTVYVHHKQTQYVCITHTQHMCITHTVCVHHTHTQYMCITNTHSMCASQTQHTAQCTTPEARGCKVFFAVTNKSYALVHMDRNCIALHADMNTLGIRYKQFVSHVPDAELARTVHCNFPPYSFYLFTVHWMCITCMTVMSPRILFLFTGCVLRI